MPLLRQFRWFAATALLAALATRGATAQAPTGFAALERVNFATTAVTAASLEPLALGELRKLRGLVFGRHGRVFHEDKDIDAYLRAKPWYRADTLFRNTRLNARERANLDLIREWESRHHATIQTGDLRWYRERVITSAMLGHHEQPGDWQVLQAEVEAIHGKVFVDARQFASREDRETYCDVGDAEGLCVLQDYFDDRYWYKPNPGYKATELTARERANIDTILLAKTRDLGFGVMPGMMYLFEQVPLDDSLLARVRLYDLRLLRNEVYARHGRRFSTPWLRTYFAQQPWYAPRGDFDIRDLSPADSVNIARIQAAETRRHERLSTDSLMIFELDGLYPEAARRLRNEILARHGRIFRDRRLQGYFASLPWYTPDPNFSERSLSLIERLNIQTISEYEARARRGERFTVG